MKREEAPRANPKASAAHPEVQAWLNTARTALDGCVPRQGGGLDAEAEPMPPGGPAREKECREFSQKSLHAPPLRDGASPAGPRSYLWKRRRRRLEARAMAPAAAAAMTPAAGADSSPV